MIKLELLHKIQINLPDLDSKDVNTVNRIEKNL